MNPRSIRSRATTKSKEGSGKMVHARVIDQVKVARIQARIEKALSRLANAIRKGDADEIRAAKFVVRAAQVAKVKATH